MAPYTDDIVQLVNSFPTLTASDLLLGSQVGGIRAKELGRLCGMLPGHIMESRGRNVVGLALANQAVVLENVLLFRVIDIRLGPQDLLGFASELLLA